MARPIARTALILGAASVSAERDQIELAGGVETNPLRRTPDGL